MKFQSQEYVCDFQEIFIHRVYLHILQIISKTNDTRLPDSL